MESNRSAIAFGLGMLCVFGVGAVRADVRLAPLFCDHAVLQQGVAVPVWGWADAGEAVTVSIAGQSKAAKAGADGAWRVTLDALKPGATLTLTVAGKNTLTVQDVLVGEVWLGSGQSNMAMTVNRCKDYEQELAAASLPQIRMFTVEREVGKTPQSACKGAWVVCATNTVGGFSATAYFFGRELHRKLGVPVGLINSSWGGTPVEAWTSAEAMSAVPALKVVTDPWAARTAQPWDEAKAMAGYDKQVAAWKEAVKKAKAAGKPLPRAPKKPVDPRLDSHYPANLFNGMIAPLIPYAIKGAVWYQGESNANDLTATLYGLQLETKILDWRKRWGTDFPYAWVQLPNYRSSDRNWPLVREGMLQTLKVPKTGMATTMDIGETGDIHPKNKQEVGRRLSLWALGAVYGQKVEALCGPLYAGHTIKGSEVTCTFTHADGGLSAKGGELAGFVIAGADQAWKPAAAKIAGSAVVVSSAEVKEPVAVRYAWAADPACNLFNGAGLPASPFRTDRYELPASAQK
jgi:sialate O-acetylesterase